MTKEKLQKKKEIIEKIKTAVITIATAVFCFIGSDAKLLGCLSPVCVDVVASVNGIANLTWCFLASLVGYLLTGNFNQGLVQICSMTLIFGIRLVMILDSRKQRQISKSVMTVTVMLAMTIITNLVMPVSTYNFSYGVISAFVCGLLVYFADDANRSSADGLLDINGIKGVTLAVLYVAVVATLTSVSVAGVNVGRVFGIFVLLCAVQRYTHIGGAVCGALTTCGVILCSPDLSKNTLLLATSGLICGAFAEIGLFVSVLIFLVSSLISLATIGLNNDTFYMFVDVLVGAIVFSAVPPSVSRKLTLLAGGKRNAVDVVGQAASSKLSFASRTLCGIRTQVNEVAEALNKRLNGNDMQNEACVGVCMECLSGHVCWDEKYTATANAFSQIEKQLVSAGTVTSQDVLNKLPECRCSTALAGVYNNLYSERMHENANSVRVDRLRELLTEQLSAMEDILSDLSHKVGQMNYIDASLSGNIRDRLRRMGYDNARACVYFDENRSYRAEVFVPNFEQPDLVKLTLAVSEILDADMELPKSVVAENITRLVFTEKPTLSLEFGSFQASCKDNEFCGDTIEFLPLNNTEQFCVLSDGMGTGKRARLDSMFATNLAVRLLKAGISAATSIKLINSVLRVKGWEESFATLDIARVDLCRGFAEIIKAGAVPSYVIRDGNILSLEAESLPIGILCGADCASVRTKVFDGDYIVLTSDGVSETIVRQAAGIISQEKSITAEELAFKLGSIATSRVKAAKHDDMSVIVIRITDISE